MHRYLVPATAIAALAIAALGAYQLAAPSVPEVVFRNAALPKMLLPDAKNHECRRFRTEDGKGGAVDLVDMDNGFTKKVFFKVLPRVEREETYYPASPQITDCDSFVPAYGAQASAQGPLFKESQRTADGKRPVYERQWSPEHKLQSEGKLLADANKFETKHFNDAGMVDSSKVFDLLRNRPESESYYNDRGLKTQTRFVTMSPLYFADYFYAEDGVTVAWKDDRSFGSYTIDLLYGDGVTTKLEAKRMPYNTTYTEFRPDGSKSRMIRVMDNNFVDVVYYDNDGKSFQTVRFEGRQVNGKAVLDAAGKPVLEILSLSLIDDKDNPSRVYTFKNGRLKTVVEVPNRKIWADRTEYTVDAQGNAVSKKVWNEKGDYVGETALAADGAPHYAVERSLTVAPTWTTPEKLGQYDTEVNREVPRGYGY